MFTTSRAVVSLPSRKCSRSTTIFSIVTRSLMASAQPSIKRTLGRKSQSSGTRKVKRSKREKNIRAGGSSEDVLHADIRSLLRPIDFEGQEPVHSPPQLWTEVEVRIEALSSTGDGLGRGRLRPSHVFAVPFTAPGDLVVAKVVSHVLEPTSYIKADFVRVIEPSLERDDSLVRCRYFTECSGCQFQMLPYSYQLEHKKTIVERAYRNFSGLPQDLIPSVGDTIGSPLQYAYRTKLTPHFDGPKNGRKLARKGQKACFEEVPPIGFHKKQMHRTMDIEECPISTNAVQLGLRRERARVKAELAKYSKGATLLLRESTDRIQLSEVPADVKVPGFDAVSQTYYEHSGSHIHAKTCITDPRSTFTEYVDDFRIRNNANSFFQNNNSILSTFVSYIRSQVVPAPSSSPTTLTINNLVDAYSGCGLFSITLSSLFKRTIGIDIDNSAIDQARENIRENIGSVLTDVIAGNDASRQKLPTQINNPENGSIANKDDGSQDHAREKSRMPDREHFNGSDGEEGCKRLYEPEFIAADASQLFASIKTLNPAETVVILDPPRKGCDESFLRQLLDFSPERIVYVSCNVHTQASDVGWMLMGGQRPRGEGEDDTVGGDLGGTDTSAGQRIVTNGPVKYHLESLRGFDFFPQTGHVESVAVLRRQRF